MSVRRTIPMGPHVQFILEQFRWRMQRARVLLSSPADLDALGLDEEHTELFRQALASYIRENAD